MSSSQKKKAQPLSVNPHALNLPLSRSVLMDKSLKRALRSKDGSHLPEPQKTLRSLVVDLERCIEQAQCEIPDCLQECMKILRQQTSRDQRPYDTIVNQAMTEEESVNSKSMVNLRRFKIKKVASKEMLQRVRAAADQKPTPLTLCGKAMVKHLEQQLDEKEEKLKLVEQQLKIMKKELSDQRHLKKELEGELQIQKSWLERVTTQKDELEQELGDIKQTPLNNQQVGECNLLREKLAEREAELTHFYQVSLMTQQGTGMNNYD